VTNGVGRRTASTLVLVAAGALVAVVAGIYVAFGLATARETLGCDFSVYQSAAEQFLRGQPIYDLSITKTGSCNVFQYPPPFVLLALPFALLGFNAGNAAWIAFLIACFVVGCAVMPVRREIRVAILLAGVVSWPFIFGVRIGQVAPILFLLFSIGWRGLDRPAITGIAAGLGAMIKLQPGLIVVWLALRGSWSGVVAAVATVGVVAGLAALVGLGSWVDMLTLVRTLSNATDVPANVSIGAVVYRLGASSALAGAIQLALTVAALVLVVVSARRSSAQAGYLTAVIASQVVSPIMWTHYALVLLLPVAWLLEQRQWWAAIVPIGLAWVLLPFTPLEAYPIAFYVTLVAVPLVDWRRPRASSAEPALAAAAAPQ
jgi:hypothetical protein